MNLLNKALTASPVRQAWGIFVGAFVLRLIYLIYLQTQYPFFHNPSADVTYYIEWANRIADGPWIGTSTFYGLPLFPYVLAFLKIITFNHSFLLLLSHISIGSGICALAYLVTRHIFGNKVAVLSGILTATNFSLIYYSCLLMPVTIVAFLSLLIVLILIEKEKYLCSWHECFFLGLLIGITILGDGKILIFLAMILVVDLMRPRFLSRGRWLPVIFGVIVILLSCGVRNRVVGGSWVLISAQSGYNLFIGNHRESTGIFSNPDFVRPTHQGQDEDIKMVAEQESGQRLSDAEVSRFWKKQAIAQALQDPGGQLQRLLHKAYLFFVETEQAYDLDLIFQIPIKNKIDLNPYQLMVPLALAGIFLIRRRNKNELLLLAMISSQLIFTIIFYLIHRHRATIYPYWIMYEAAFLIWLADHLQARRLKPVFGGISIVLVLSLIFPSQFIPAEKIAYLRHTKIGAIYNQRNQTDLAKIHLTKALALEPQDSNALYNLANAYFLEGDLSRAVELYRRVVALQPRQSDALYNLAYTQEQLQQWEGAIITYEKVLQLQPDSPDVLYRLARLYIQEETCERALPHIKWLKRIIPAKLAVELRPDFGDCWP